MEKLDLVLIGHFALDTIIIKETMVTTRTLGGGVTYGSLAAVNYDPSAKIGIVSRVNKNFDKSLFSIFEENAPSHNIDLSGIKYEGIHSTNYQLIYHDNDRDLKLISRAPNCEVDDIPLEFFNTKAIHLTPIADEFSLEFLEEIAKRKETKKTLFGIDVQGLIRGFDDEGNIYMKNDENTRENIIETLKHFGNRILFKGSDKEIQAVSGIDNLKEATTYLSKTGAHIFTTLGPKGLYYKNSNHPLIHINAYKPDRVLDETGAGDCFMATLLLEMGKLGVGERTFEKLLEILKLASASSSFLVEQKGPQGYKSKREIMERIENGKEIQ